MSVSSFMRMIGSIVSEIKIEISKVKNLGKEMVN